LVYGDSISEDGGADDPLGAYSSLIGPGLDAEYSICAFSGQGWASPNSMGGVPNLLSTWNQNWNGHARDFTSLPPDYILIGEGVNDLFGSSSGALTSAILTILPALRAACPSAWIFVLIPFGNHYASTITAAFTSYQSASPDAKCVLISVPPKSVTGFPVGAGIGAATWQTVDSVHPNLVAHGTMASAVENLIADAIGGGVSSNVLIPGFIAS
jgi:lysophospholipase L1-like esterase